MKHTNEEIMEACNILIGMACVRPSASSTINKESDILREALEERVKLLELLKHIKYYLHNLVLETNNGEHQIRTHTLRSAEILREDLTKFVPDKPMTLEGTTQQMNTDQKSLDTNTKDSWGFRATFKLDPK